MICRCTVPPCVVGQVAADEAGRGRIAAAHDLYVGGELYLAEVREIGVDFGAPGRPPAAYAVRGKVDYKTEKKTTVYEAFDENGRNTVMEKCG